MPVKHSINNVRLISRIAFVLAALACLAITPVRAQNQVSPLAFNADGHLKILQITDIHWKDGGNNDMKSLSLFRKLVEKESPDVVVFTGDIVYGKKCPDPKEGLERIVAIPIGRNIPWTFTPGNHDGHGPLSRKEIVDYLRSRPLCLMNGSIFCADGVSHMVPVYSTDRDRVAAALFLFDSTGDGTRTNTYITADISQAQVDWYEKEGGGLNAVAFMHKPSAEFFSTCKYKKISGCLRLVLPYNKTESALIRAFTRFGTMRAVFCGHLHVNSLLLDAGGVTLGFTRSAGYNAFGFPWVPRGGRVILLTGGGSGMETWEPTE